MTLDGKIATTSGESKWITSEASRAWAMKLRQGADAILVGVNTVLADNPSLTWRRREHSKATPHTSRLRRIVLDSRGRTPLESKVVSDDFAHLTTIVVAQGAPKKRVLALSKHVNVWLAPERGGGIDLRWLLKKLGTADVTSLLVEGGGEVNASSLSGGFAQRVAFFYAPKIIGGRSAPQAVGGEGITKLADAIQLHEVEWRRLGPDLLLNARVAFTQRKTRRVV